MKTSDFDYSLPPELIAQTPVEPRDRARLLVLNRGDNSLKHHEFHEVVDYLQDGDVLVFNDSRVIPARLTAKKADTGGGLEILLLRCLSPGTWETLVRPGRRVRLGTGVEITGSPLTAGGQDTAVTGEVVGMGESGIKVISFSDEALLTNLGEVPLPPYIHLPLADPERYQTVYASVDGSVAAPTAGLHFTAELIDRIKARGVKCLFMTLHVGLDTFRPVKEEDPSQHPVHKEYAFLDQEVAGELSQARKEGRRIICVGTTTVRLVEAVAQFGDTEQISAFSGWVDLFITPGYRFRMVDAMITNFHLPRTTLLMMVAAFVGKDFLSRAYQEAIARRYHFYSFGDAMLII
ncbi:MAG: tRNA preQ1(34) S-adenosylmethionine ribosyltransferase-isomerase QueA [Dehalococcoidales bacterium]|nr:MAG: tRNA preQ1(34) S-adenosylmethionine ribosyltransferase-isomerase QueA [Dehalococcoidales bacterium]